MSKEKLGLAIVKGCLGSQYLSTRSYALPEIAGMDNAFIKRDDELSSGVIGSKLRKYASLLKAIKDQGITKALAIGGDRSNNILSLIQLLTEHRIDYELWLKESSHPELSGNKLWIEFLSGPENIKQVSNNDWPQVEKLGEEYLAEKEDKTFLIPEGANQPESLLGAMTLGADILKNELELGVSFQDIFIDAGTGLSAIALILYLSVVGAEKKVHVCLIAGQEQEFEDLLRKYANWLEGFLESEPIKTIDYQCYKPNSAASFGSINATVRKEWLSISRDLGILMDPLYSIKHFYSARKRMRELPKNRPKLLVYSGGSLAAANYESLAKSLINH